MQLAPQACSRRTVRDSSPEQAAFELRLEGQLGCDNTKGRMEVSVPRGEQHPEGSSTRHVRKGARVLRALGSCCWV